jgi:hypothetical protein
MSLREVVKHFGKDVGTDEGPLHASTYQLFIKKAGHVPEAVAPSGGTGPPWSSSLRSRAFQKLQSYGACAVGFPDVLMFLALSLLKKCNTMQPDI